MSFAGEIRRAVMASPRMKLPEIRSAMYKAFTAGQITETEAETLDTLINARAAIPATETPARRRVGSRARSSASMERRRSWAAAGRLPPAIAAKFTVGEQAVLAVVALEVAKKGACALALGHLAALAGVSISTAKRALREARALQFVSIEERRLTAWRSAPNVVRLIAPEWTSWLRLTRPSILKGGGGQFSPATNTDSKSSLAQKRENINARQSFRSEQDPAEPDKGFRQSRGG